MLPSEVIIGGITYPITWVQELADVQPDDTQNCYGAIRYRHREIRIWIRQSPAALAQTLLHEVMHGISENGHIPCLRNAAGDDDNEHAIHAVSNAVFDVLWRNGWLNPQLFPGMEA